MNRMKARRGRPATGASSSWRVPAGPGGVLRGHAPCHDEAGAADTPAHRPADCGHRDRCELARSRGARAGGSARAGVATHWDSPWNGGRRRGGGHRLYDHAARPARGPTGKSTPTICSPRCCKSSRDKARTEHLSNVEIVQGTETDARLPDNAIDLALLVDVYHELWHPQEMLRSIRRSLKPNGELVLVEYRKGGPEHSGSLIRTG